MRNGQLAVVGTDGGQAGKRPTTKRGAWAVSVLQEDGSHQGTAGRYHGMDSASAATEAEAALRLVRAAVEAQARFHVFIDNQAIQKNLDQCLRGVIRPDWRYAFAYWREVEELARTLPPGCRAHWVPSHGKKEGWQPPAPYRAEQIMSLNDHADLAVQAVESSWYAESAKEWDEEATAATTTCAMALRRLVEGERHFVRRYLPDDEQSSDGEAPAAQLE